MITKVLGAFCAIAALIAVFGYFFSEEKLSTEDFVVVMAKTANDTAPRMINEEVRIDGANATGKELITRYTFVDLGEGDISEDALLNLVRPGVVSQACSHPETLAAFKRDIIFTYIYQDSVGNSIARLSVDKDTCM